MPIDAVKAKLLGAYRAFSTPQLIIIGLLAVGGIFGAFTLLKWVNQPSYAVLYSGLSDKDTSAVTNKLTTDGVAYKLAGNGNTVLVPRSKLNAERVSVGAAGVVQSDQAGWSVLDKESMTTSDFKQQVDYQRALEGQIANAVSSMSGVDSAQVNIVMPTDSAFLSAAQPARASVLLSTNTAFQQSSVPGIVSLVASSVPNLDSSAVSVTDGSGHLLAGPGASTSGSSTDTPAADGDALSAKAQAMLDAMLGAGHATVQVDVTTDPSKRTTDSETYNPKSAVPLTQSTTSETYGGTGAAGLGSGGTLGTTNGSTTTSGSTGTTTGTSTTSTGTNGNYAKTSNDSTFGVDRTVEHAETPAGAVSKITAAVAIDNTVANLPASDRLQALVSAAIGAQTSRGDSVVITEMPFKKLTTSGTASAKKGGLLSGKTLTSALAVLLLIGASFQLLRMARKPRTKDLALPDSAVRALGAGTVPALPGGSGAQAALPPGMTNGIVGRVEEEPDEVARLLRDWLSESDTKVLS